ncbi:M20/M25/M40 family metallo-hydrolase [Sulfurimonas sp. MAG313]|nr:M20/M25/M40 family metallo-hydrolase [Sulfurimonas sp. MAG313]MDF1882245.1 M20/M25/M40 family metallo-hydrolase [Sulfurimonas sp. MAG313]
MSVLEIFKKICQLPHCSHEAHALKNHLIQEAKLCGYEVSVDAYDNILCAHPKAKLILQSHYDMVCIGEAPNLELYEEEGYLKAKNSSLGADNGIGIAMMLSLMRKNKCISCLFTANEEVGLIGAQNLSLPIKESLMLNLDTEEEGFVYIGCAGGTDVICTQPLRRSEIDEAVHSYHIIIDNLPGGHSGVDIHKSIPSALKELAAFLVHIPHYLISFEGGERRNSISKRASAVISVPEGVILDEKVGSLEIRALKDVHTQMIDKGHKISEMIHAFAQGVRSMDTKLNIVQNSINLALVHMDEDQIKISLSARSMDNEELLRLVDETMCFFKAFDFEVKSEGSYPAWKPEPNDFAYAVQTVCQKHFEKADFMAIHAGLECAILKSYAPHLDIASIGPNIYNPHSSRESVEITSVNKVYTALEEIVEKFSD